MEAFVQTDAFEYENVNFFTAAKGFYELGYYVNKFDPRGGVPEGIDGDTPVYAGIPMFKRVMEKLGVKYKEQEAYPHELRIHMHRHIQFSTLGDVRKNISKWVPFFMRPADDHRKRFNGQVIKSVEDLRDTLHISEETPVLLTDVVNFVSEYRVYVLHNQILDIKHYKGDPLIFPSAGEITCMVAMYADKAPVAYCLDVGVLDTHETALVEVNDAINMGNYGLPATHFARMIDARWLEITRFYKMDR